MAGVSYSYIGPQEKVYTLILPRRARLEIERIVSARYPIEACGVMMGRVYGDTAEVLEIAELRNVLASTVSFWFNEAEWMERILEGGRRGLEYIGIFHSHNRSEPMPSMADRHRMLECPGELWLIVAYTPETGFKYAAWRIDDWGSSILKLELLLK